MRFLCVLILFFSFVDAPSLLPVLDDSHTVALQKEHGVWHLIIFRSPDSHNTSSGTLTSGRVNEDHHEFHLSTSSVLTKKQVTTLFLTQDIPLANGYAILTTLNASPSANIFETDIGAFDPPAPVLRI